MVRIFPEGNADVNNIDKWETEFKAMKMARRMDDTGRTLGEWGDRKSRRRAEAV